MKVLWFMNNYYIIERIKIYFVQICTMDKAPKIINLQVKQRVFILNDFSKCQTNILFRLLIQPILWKQNQIICMIINNFSIYSIEMLKLHLLYCNNLHLRAILFIIFQVKNKKKNYETETTIFRFDQ